MRVLLIDTSSDYLYVSFYDDVLKERIYFKNKISHNNHSENIIGVIEEGLNECNIKLMDFDKVVVGYGPGSYTGLRVGMVVAKMTAYCVNVPLYVVSSLSFVGSGHFKNDGIYAIYNIAKKGHCYTKVVSVKDNAITELVEDKFMTNEEFNELVKEYEATIINNEIYQVDEEVIISLSQQVDDIHEIVPNYLRKANS